MDQYQINLINRTTNIALTSSEGCGKAEIKGGEIVFTQNENYKVTSYTFEFANSSIESIDIDGQKYSGVGTFKVAIDFNLKKKKLTVHFKNNFGDPYTFDLKYIDADKSSFDIKVDEENKARLLQVARIHAKTGIDLINVYWCNCCNEVAYTKVTLYEKEGRQLLVSYNSEPNVFFKSVTGLAFNEYIVQVEQLAKDDKVIISTELNIQIKDLYNEVNKGLNELKTALGEVKSQVRASGRYSRPY